MVTAGNGMLHRTPFNSTLSARCGSFQSPILTHSFKTIKIVALKATGEGVTQSNLRHHCDKALQLFKDSSLSQKNVALKVVCAPCYTAQILTQRCCVRGVLKIVIENCPCNIILTVLGEEAGRGMHTSECDAV